MADQTSPSKSTTSTSPTKSSLLDMSPVDFENLLLATHRRAKETAKLDSTDDSVLLAKLACYAIRELHAQQVVSNPLPSPLVFPAYSCNPQYPATAIRAMSILEYAEQRRSTGGAIKQAKRQMRIEARVRREAREQEGEETVIAEAGGDGGAKNGKEKA